MPAQAKGFSQQSFFAIAGNGVAMLSGNTHARSGMPLIIRRGEQQQVVVSRSMTTIVTGAKLVSGAQSPVFRTAIVRFPVDGMLQRIVVHDVRQSTRCIRVPRTGSSVASVDFVVQTFVSLFTASPVMTELHDH